MKTLYLHIGTHKTGTTALQRFFMRNDDSLKEKDLYYPRTGRCNMGAHHHLLSSIRKPQQHPDFPHEKTFKEYLNDLKKECNNYSNVLLSSEIMFGNIDYQQFLYLKEVFSEVKIIVYLRRQDSLIQSLYNQYVTSGQMEFTIQKFIKANSNPYLTWEWFEKIELYRDIFGKENIIVRPYEKIQFFGGNIFSDFLNVFGLELEDSYILPKSKINQSIALEELHYKLMINRLKLEEKQSRLFSGPVRENSNLKYGRQTLLKQDILSPKERLNIIQKYAETYEKIASEYLSREDRKLFYDPLPDRDEHWEPNMGLSEEKVVEITGFLADHYPNVISILTKGILKGLASDEQKVREAAEILLPALQFEKNVWSKIVRLHEKSKREKKLEV